MAQDRNKRLAADYREMQKIQDRPYLSWIVTKGEPPYAEEYLLTVRIRTYVFDMRSGVCTVGAIRSCTVRVTLWPSYPSVAPTVRMMDIPPVFHPAWYSKGSYCPPSPWRAETSLKDFVKQMLGTLRYDPHLIETAAPANYKALDWYLKHQNDPSLFPSDPIEFTENDMAKETVIEQDVPIFAEIVDRWTVK